MSDKQDVERIQFRMERIRNHMNDDVDRLQADAEQLLSWKYYLRRHPLASVATIAAAGFLLVPKSRPPVQKKFYLDPDTSREIAQNVEKLQVEQNQEGVQQGLLVSLGVLALNTLIKAGVAYAGDQVRKTWGQDFKSVDRKSQTGSPQRS